MNFGDGTVVITRLIWKDLNELVSSDIIKQAVEMNGTAGSSASSGRKPKERLVPVERCRGFLVVITLDPWWEKLAKTRLYIPGGI